MRKRSKGTNEGVESSKRQKTEELPTTTEDDRPQHVNFFSDLQTGVNMDHYRKYSKLYIMATIGNIFRCEPVRTVSFCFPV